jgi:hypothetical protein
VDLMTTFRTVNGGSMPVGSTYTRQHIQMQFRHSTTSESTLSGHVVGIVCDRVGEAAATLPSPVSDPFVDWIIRKTVYPSNSNSEYVISDHRFYGWELDLKSQRKCEELSETIYLIAEEIGPQAGAASGELTFSTAVLLKLP